MYAELCASDEVRPTFESRCTKCGGSGRWNSWSGRASGSCFACKGVGILTHKTSPEARAKATESRARTADRNATENWAAFTAANPEVAAWMDGNASFEFAVSLKAAVLRYGDLTDRQLASAQKCVEGQKTRDADRAAAAVAREAAAPAVDVGAIEAAIATAVARGVKRPALRVAGLRFSLAPVAGKNAGAVYVKEDGIYLGKVMGGKLFASRDCSEAQAAAIVEVAADPKGAAIAHGKLTGQCSICSRELTDPKSIDLGIGPICASNMGW